MFVVGQGKAGVRGEENPALPVRGKRGVGHLARFHAITVAGMRRDDYSSALMRRLVISRTAARITRMDPRMYRMVLPLPPVERGQKASPLGVRSHALGRKLSAKQTDDVPLRWLRAFIVAEARGVTFGEDLFRHGFAVPPSPSGEGLGMPFALLLLGLCSKLTT